MAIEAFKKGIDRQLSDNLHLSEMECNCEMKVCAITLVDMDNVDSFQAVRDLTGESLHINSGYRCQYWNFEVDGEEMSNHLIGAMDIKKRDELKEEYLRKHFTFVLEYPTFWHCDNRGIEL